LLRRAERMPSRAARKPDAGNPAWRYERRRPQWTLLCQLVNEPYPRFLDLLVTQGRSLPNYVWREFDDLPKTMSVAIFEQFTAGAEEPLGNVTFLVAMHLYTHVILFSNQTHGRRTQKMRSEYRRRMLIGLAAGVPTAWVKPVVDTVLLPAHRAGPRRSDSLAGFLSGIFCGKLTIENRSRR
jgi:hypothetical protein